VGTTMKNLQAAVKDGSFQRDMPPSMIKESIIISLRDDINDEQKKQLFEDMQKQNSPGMQRNAAFDGQIAAAVSQSLNESAEPYNTYQSVGQISNPGMGSNDESALSPAPPVESKPKKRLNKWGDEIDED